MNKMTFYEQVEIVIPGAVCLVGLLSYFPALHFLIAKEGITLGQFGISCSCHMRPATSSQRSAMRPKFGYGNWREECRPIG